MIGLSIVCYNNEIQFIQQVISCIYSVKIDFKLYLEDNSSSKKLNELSDIYQLEYSHNKTNIGFGAAHNNAFRKSIKDKKKYHVIINPDIFFDENVVEKLVDFMENNPNVGAVMPKVVYPDGRIQRLAKLIPSPLEYFARRFIPFNWIKNRINNRYELINYDYTYAPFLSGCFLVLRVDVLKKIGGFDENIFLYFEDNDICRKILKEGYRTVVNPFVSVVHDHTPKSFFNIKNIMIYFKSGIYYFNKWGWVFDRQRLISNKKTLAQIQN
jgi:GT2 family glycosyltransferase